VNRFPSCGTWRECQGANNRRATEILVLPQGGGHLVVRADQPGGTRAAAAELAGGGVKTGVEHLATLGEGEEPLLADRLAPMAVTEGLPGTLRHLGNLPLGVAPGLLSAVTDQRGDPQPELQRRVGPAERLGQRLEPVNPFGDAAQRLAPEELDVGLGSRNLLGRGRGTPEVQPRVPAFAGSVGPRAQGCPLDPEVPAPERDVFLGPQPPDDLEELFGPGVSLGPVALYVAVSREVVLAAHDIDEETPPAEMVERGGSARKVRRLPVAGPDRHEGLEPGGAGREGSGNGERVGTAPACANQGPAPAMVLDDPGRAQWTSRDSPTRPRCRRRGGECSLAATAGPAGHLDGRRIARFCHV
jgi:hypothetical protein